jgi:hypothetical protein
MLIPCPAGSIVVFVVLFGKLVNFRGWGVAELENRR